MYLRVLPYSLHFQDSCVSVKATTLLIPTLCSLLYLFLLRALTHIIGQLQVFRFSSLKLAIVQLVHLP